VSGLVNQSSDGTQLRELALFAGAGGGILGGKLLGWRTVCAVEINAYCAGVLVQRQNDGILAPFPIWDDVRTFDGRPWRGIVDVVSGGFPCQDISAAGNGAGIDGERSGLWREMARIIGEVRPRFAFVENSPMLTSRGLGRVLGDLAEMGYNARWGVFSGVNAGVPSRRERLWIVANKRRTGEIQNKNTFNAKSYSSWMDANSYIGTNINLQNKRKSTLPLLGNDYWTEIFNRGGKRGIDGLANRVERERCIGNGQIPSVARLAWKVLTGESYE